MTPPPRAAGLLLALLGYAAVDARQGLPDAVRAAAESISSEQLAWDLAHLTSDEQQGRNTPSTRFDAAADYIAARLARAGLTPAGDDGTFRQHYELHETRVDTDAASITIAERRFAFGRDFAMRSLATPVSGPLPVVYVGHGWVLPGRGIDPYAGVDVRGKLVLAHGPRVLPKGVEVQQVGRTVVNADPPFVAAAARGAAGVLFITQATELVRWDELRGANTIRRELEPGVPSAYAAPPITSVLLAPQVTEALLEGESLGGRAALSLADRGEFPASFQLKKQVTVHVPVASRSVSRPFNIVAMLEGSDPRRKAEAVTIAAHLDGAVGTRSVDGDAIYNSADDNGSGSAALLSIAEHMAGAPRPKRTIVFMWDSGEEQGSLGHPALRPRAAGPAPRHRRPHQRGHDRRKPPAGVRRRSAEDRHGTQRGVPHRPPRAERAGGSAARSRQRQLPEAALQPGTRSGRRRVLLPEDRCGPVPGARDPDGRVHHRHPSALSPARGRGAIPRSRCRCTRSHGPCSPASGRSPMPTSVPASTGRCRRACRRNLK